MKRIYIITIILVAVLWACSNSNGPSQNQGNPNPINYNNLKVGQKDYYVSYQADNYYDTTNYYFNYLRDTLVVEVESISQNKIFFKEYLLDTSAKGIGYTSYRDSIFRYYVNLNNNELKFYKLNPDSYGYSHLFSKEIDSMRLSLVDFTNKIGTLHGWQVSTDSLGMDDSCYILNSIISGHNYARLNVILNDRPMSFDGTGFTYIYSKSYGIIRSLEVNPWLMRGVGWELIF